MKNIVFLMVACFSLTACSLLERRIDQNEGIPTNSTDSAEGEVSLQKTDYLEKELSRLNAKVEALETKVEVLTTSLEKQQLRGSTPVTANEAFTQTAPSVALGETINTTPLAGGSINSGSSINGIETEFKSAMELFQNGKNLEAGVAFSNFAHLNPSHHLAAHALYWSGEANARGEQWKLAISSWEELQKKYPNSAYVPETLAGLVRAYSSAGYNEQAADSRAVLLRSYAQAPAALSLQSTNPTPASPQINAQRISDEVPAEEHSALEKSSIEAPFREQPIENGDEESE